MKYKAYTLNNYQTIPQLNKLSKEAIETIKIIGHVLPFKVDNYVLDELIDWENYESDPIFHLIFLQKEMLKTNHFDEMETALKQSSNKNFHIEYE